MKSQYSEYFNHDEDADFFDEDVQNENNPVRTGYSEILRITRSLVPSGSRVLDLGCGTGNTILALKSPASVTAVDVSEKMMEIAGTKLPGRNIEYIRDDILHFVDSNDLRSYQYIVSTYALHHLTPDEKNKFLKILAEKTSGHVRILIGDLMYENRRDLERLIEKYRNTHPDVLEGFSLEFYWNVEETKSAVCRLDLSAEFKRISDLSWFVGIKISGDVP